MIKKSDSQQYTLTWEKLEKVFGDNPNWEKEIEFYAFMYETMMEEGSSVLEGFDEIANALDAQGADRKRFNAFQQMVLNSSNSKDIERVDDSSTELSEFDLHTPVEETVVYHSFKNLDELLKYSAQDAIKREEQSPEFNEASAWSKDVTLQDTNKQNPDETVIEQTVSEDDSKPGA